MNMLRPIVQQPFLQRSRVRTISRRVVPIPARCWIAFPFRYRMPGSRCSATRCYALRILHIYWFPARHPMPHSHGSLFPISSPDREPRTLVWHRRTMLFTVLTYSLLPAATGPALSPLTSPLSMAIVYQQVRLKQQYLPVLR